MSKVVLLGFGLNQAEGRVYDGRWNCEVWTLNDWWRFYPDFTRPSRVYQMHENYDGRHATNSGRTWPGWKRKYNKSGAEIVTANGVDGLDNSRVFDFDRGDSEFGKLFFGCTVNYMVADAIFEGKREIEIIGFPLRGAEYEYQSAYMVRAVALAREKGIKVVAPDEHSWRGGAVVDWAALNGVETRYGQAGFVPIRVAK